MPLLQHYYTSFSNPITGSVGFQCKAMSPGISSEDQKILNTLIGYRIPTSKVDQPISSHPIALRYIYLHSDKCMLVCSQSNGNDENGRPGNFFAHSLITSPEDFDVFPPIMYWKHSFWRNRDESTSQEIPPLPLFNENPSLDFQQVWPFINAGERREWLYKMLCAVLQYNQTKRPIVILDSVDNIALWILSVTIALPQKYRNYISFATYHHDPYAGQFLITGTTADSKFRFSSDEYITFFVMNVEQKRISEIPDSVYARFVLDNLTPEYFESKLLDLFHLCNEQLPSSRKAPLNNLLSPMVRFYQTVREKDFHTFDAQTQESLRTFINYAQTQNLLTDDTLDDLIATTDVLVENLGKKPEISVVKDYLDALRLLKRFHPTYTKNIHKSLNLLTKMILENFNEITEMLINGYMSIYPVEEIKNAVSQVEYLNRLSVESRSKPVDSQMQIWKFLVSLLRIDTTTRPYLGRLIINGLKSVEELTISNSLVPPSVADGLLDMMINARKDNNRIFLEIGTSVRSELSALSFMWFYYKFVEDLSVVQRKPYRDLVLAKVPDVVSYEIRRDINRGGLAQIIPTLMSWLESFTGSKSKQADIINIGIDSAWNIVPQLQRSKFSESILSDTRIVPYIDEPHILALLESYLSSMDFRTLDSKQLQLFQTYVSHQKLSLKLKAIIGGTIAMTTGQFPPNSSQLVNQYLKQLDQTSYTTEAGKLISCFFQRDIKIETHVDMLRSLYIKEFDENFWVLYWPAFKLLITNKARVLESVRLLSFWFDESLGVLGNTPYIVQSFFLKFPTFLDELRSEKGFDHIIKDLYSHSAKLGWFALLDRLLADRSKKNILQRLSHK